MLFTTSVSYLSCQTCQAKIHCEDCGRRLEEILLNIDGVSSICVDLPNQHLNAEANLSLDDFAELLEEHGLFSDL